MFSAASAFEMNLVESYIAHKVKDKVLGHKAAASEHVTNAAEAAVSLLGNSKTSMIDKAAKATANVSQIIGLLMTILRYKNMLMHGLPAVTASASALTSHAQAATATTKDVSMNTLWSMLKGNPRENEVRQEILSEPEPGSINLPKLESLMRKNLPSDINRLAGQLYMIAQAKKENFFGF